MPRQPLIVLADDLTGAAEIAAIGHAHGLRAVVLTRVPREPLDADVLVFDTDTRLARPAAAVRRVRTVTARLKTLPHTGFFKKTDSVLRGPVLAELIACAQALDRRRALLVAANPSLGRTILDGRLLIAGRPIDKTPFARDPHHPAHSAHVLELLGARKDTRVIALAPGDPMRRSGVMVGDHRSAADTTKWAEAVDRTTLPAGAADFFRAWLQTKRWNPASGRVGSRARPPTGNHPLAHPRPPRRFTDADSAYPENPSGLSAIASAKVEGQVPPQTVLEPAVLLHGTTAAPSTNRLLRFNGLRPPPVVRVVASIRHRGSAAIAATSLTLGDPLAPPIIARNFGRLARGLRDAGAFRHLLIAGGATAASVLRALGWSRLEVVRLWGPGVVSLQPVNAPGFTVTLKPGSYPWPDSIRRAMPAVFS